MMSIGNVRRRTPVSAAASLAALALGAFLAACDGGDGTRERPQIEVVSTRAQYVSGGDALVRIRLPEGASSSDIVVLANDTDVTGRFEADDTGALVGVIDALPVGESTIEVRPVGEAEAAALLTLRNWPVEGPIISGPHETPFVCTTDEFVLPDGSLLGMPLDENCSAQTRVHYVYRTNTQPATFQLLPQGARPADLATATTMDGVTVPYIVRVETGTINRAIYQTAILHDPANDPEPTPLSPPPGWNGKLIYPLGGGCQGGWYVQGLLTLNSPDFGMVTLLNVTDDTHLRKGYGVASSTLNIFANNCNDLLSSETTMMVKERFIESYGVPVYTIGTGGSGGAYQSNQTAQNYPGLFDGIITTASFPDATTGFVTLADSRLLDIYFNETRPGQYSPEKQHAISGMRQPGNIVFLSRSPTTSALRLDPRASFSLVTDFPQALRYDPVTNPGGARATPYDHTVNVYGRRPATGFAQRPLDNVGVQYGLKALNDGAITVDEFLDLNENVGGFDIDFNHVPQRTVADLDAVRRAYRSGRIIQGSGGLSTMPIMTQPGYDEGRAPDGGIHLEFWSYAIRERLIEANGNADNQVIIGPGTVTDDRFEQMDRWLMAIKDDTSDAGAAAKVANNRPQDVVDACWDAAGNKIVEPQTAFGPGQCNTLYPTDMAPNLVAGAPLASDVIKCQLRPIAMTDYVPMFSAEQQARLAAIFPDGVCDWTQPSVGHEPLQTWASFGPSPENLVFDITQP